MLVTIEGTYKNGRIELAEQPSDLSEAKVVVVFLTEKPKTETIETVKVQVVEPQTGKSWFGRAIEGASTVGDTIGGAAISSKDSIAGVASKAYEAAGGLVSQVHGKATDAGDVISQHTYPLLAGLTSQAGNVVEVIADNPTVRQVAATFKLEHWLDVSEHVDIEKAQEIVNELKQRYPDDQPNETAHRLMVQKAIYAGGLGLSTSLIPGAAIPLLAVDLAATALLQAELVYQIAAAYELDLEDPARKGEILAVFGCVLGANRVAKLGLVALKTAPVVGAVIGASSNAAMIYALGYAACKFYEEKLHLEVSTGGIQQLKQHNELYLEEAMAQEVIADQVLFHIVLAGNPSTPKTEIMSALQTLNLSPASLEAIVSDFDAPQPLDILLSRLEPDFAAYVLSQCQRVAQLDGVTTKEEATMIEQITRRFHFDSICP